MKNLLYILFAALTVVFVGCSDDDTDGGASFAEHTVSLSVSFDGVNNASLQNGDKLSLYKKGSYKIADLEYKSSSTDGATHIFETKTTQPLVDSDEYTAQYPASSSPTYSSVINNIEGLQVGSDTDTHLLNMSRYECDFTPLNNSGITLKSKFAIISFEVNSPAAGYNPNSDGEPTKIELRIEDGESYSISTLNLQDIQWSSAFVANVAALPKAEGTARKITLTVSTTANKNFAQTLTQAADVSYTATQVFDVTLSAIEHKEPEFVESLQTFTIDENVKQGIYIGLDAERLWYWRDNLRDELAQLSVGDIDVKFARVVIDGGYELTEGVQKPEVYDVVINMMKAFRAKKPDLLFFATPRPIFNSYTVEERIALFGHEDNTPWSSVPLWAYEFKQSGTKTMEDGTVVPNYVGVGYNKEKLVRYFADYLNLMYKHGFEFEYMDLTNETETRTTPDIYKYVKDNLPAALDAGVKMPKLIAPSSWSVLGGIEWMDTVEESEKDGFDIAAVHNTGLRSGNNVFRDMKLFADKAVAMGKEPWNTELHDWMGISTYDEVMSSNYFFDYFRAGYVGMSGWLFFGPANGKDHSKLWVGSTPGSHTKSAKYEIFKEIVNNTNGGNYVDSSVDVNIDGVTCTAFVKGNVLTIALLNKTEDSNVVTFNLGTKSINGQMRVREWNGDLPKSGRNYTVAPTTASKFQYSIGAESLYIFTMNLN